MIYVRELLAFLKKYKEHLAQHILQELIYSLMACKALTNNCNKHERYLFLETIKMLLLMTQLKCSDYIYIASFFLSHHIYDTLLKIIYFPSKNILYIIYHSSFVG